MKTNILLLFITTAIISSCSKKDTTPAAPAAPDSYLNVNSGSTWNYNEIDSSKATPTNTNYSITSTSADTTINSKQYHVYSYSYGGSEYLNLTGDNYYQYDSIPGGLGQVIERLYLEDNATVNATWSQNFSVNITGVPLAIPVTLTNEIVAEGITVVVNGITYTNVIQVSTTISSTLIPAANLTSSIESYYAPNYGLIANSTLVNLNYSGLTEYVNTKTLLLSTVLK